MTYVCMNERLMSSFDTDTEKDQRSGLVQANTGQGSFHFTQN